jgi:hypothetical protein
MGAQFAQINKPINLAQQMIARDPILQAKLIKQLRLIGLLSSQVVPNNPAYRRESRHSPARNRLFQRKGRKAEIQN